MDGKTITAFREKPEQESAYISGGFMVLEPKIADYLDGGDACVFERGPLERLAQEGQLKAHTHDGFWQCMDTYREQQLLEKLWSSGQAPWKKW
jgi:glucose-1-phosphate cytidylyltransferase